MILWPALSRLAYQCDKNKLNMQRPEKSVCSISIQLCYNFYLLSFAKVLMLTRHKE